MRPAYDPAIRSRALRMLTEGITVTDIAAALGVHRTVIQKWVRSQEPKPVKVLTPAGVLFGMSA